jgi:hypothetical protein
MTFTEIKTEIAARLNLTSTEALDRIGREINARYQRIITTAIGLVTSRRTQVQADVTLGVQTLTFTGIEKVISVIDKTSGSDRILDHVSVDELKQGSIGTAAPNKFAIYRMNAGSVEILMDTIPQAALTLYADGHETASTLSGAQEPGFSESFHDILIEGVLADEYRKLEKLPLAAASEAVYERRLGELRMWIAKSAFQDIYQGKTAGGRTVGGTASGGSSAPNGASSYTQTGLITFDRDPLAPFAVTASSAVVPNLDADKLDGEEGSAYHNASNLNAGTVPDARFPATLPAVSGANLTNLDASDLASGTVPDARFPATLPAVSGANLTNLDATDLTGTIAQARLGAGTFSVVTSTSTGAQNNWAPTLVGNTFIEWNGASLASITGLDGGVSGQIVTIKNITAAQIITFANASGSSDVDNRFANHVTSGVTPVAAGGWIRYQHDGTNWKIIGHEQGEWITPTFAAGNFTGSSSMTWTVAAGDVLSFAYRVRGKELTLNFYIQTTTVGGTPDVSLQLVLPGGFSAAKRTDNVIRVDNNGTPSAGHAVILEATSTFLCRLINDANWAAATDATGLRAVFTLEVT